MAMKPVWSGRNIGRLKSMPINHWIANSKEVKKRIAKFYRKDATVIYPPCDVENIIRQTQGSEVGNYFLIASRFVGAKGIKEAIAASEKIGFDLKIVGEGSKVGRVSDEELYQLYAKAKGFIALAREEDFGMTVVESMAAGTPVIAFNGGGFKETVIDGKTGVFVNEVSIPALKQAIKRVDEIAWKRSDLINQARKFSKENFIKKIRSYIKTYETT